MITKTKKSAINYILICCCTYKRPEKLARLLRSLKEINYPVGIKTEILVVDNDRNSSAKGVCESSVLPVKLHYVTEEKKGLSNARNRALFKGIELFASHIAFIDDDEVADINWLVNHVDFYNRFENIYISSGPTYKKFEQNYPDYILENRIFRVHSSKKLGQVKKTCASGNVFFPINICEENDIYFSEEFNYSGSEDTDFFSRLSGLGFEIGWNYNAVNHEIVDEERASLKWILNRAFHNGYSVALTKCNGNNLKRLTYILSHLCSVIYGLFCSLVFVFLGFTKFFNSLTLLSKNLGKLFGALIMRKSNYYGE